MNSMNKQHPMGWFNFDFSQSVMDAVQDLRSPANRIGFPPTRGCRTTPASCPQNLRSGSSRKTGSRQIGNSPTSSAQNEIPYGGIGTYVRLGPGYGHVDNVWRRRFSVLVTLPRAPEPSGTHRGSQRDNPDCRHCELLRFGLAAFVRLITNGSGFLPSVPCSAIAASPPGDAPKRRRRLTTSLPLHCLAKPRLSSVHSARPNASL